MTVTLKPCPWCGGSPYLVQSSLSHGSHGYHGCYEYYIKCAECGATAPQGRFNDIYETDLTAKQQAIEAWNKRNVLNIYKIEI